MDEDSDWLFSFENICELWGYNPQYVRQGLARWKERTLAERHKAKIYRLTPRLDRNKPGPELLTTAEEALQKVAGR